MEKFKKEKEQRYNTAKYSNIKTGKGTYIHKEISHISNVRECLFSKH